MATFYYLQTAVVVPPQAAPATLTESIGWLPRPHLPPPRGRQPDHQQSWTPPAPPVAATLIESIGWLPDVELPPQGLKRLDVSQTWAPPVPTTLTTSIGWLPGAQLPPEARRQPPFIDRGWVPQSVSAPTTLTTSIDWLPRTVEQFTRTPWLPPQVVVTFDESVSSPDLVGPCANAYDWHMFQGHVTDWHMYTGTVDDMTLCPD